MKEEIKITGNIELFTYELPTWVEFISIDFLQKIIAWYYVRKTKKKIQRYVLRKERAERLKNLPTKP